jgi:hypothetical protein
MCFEQLLEQVARLAPSSHGETQVRRRLPYRVIARVLAQRTQELLQRSILLAFLEVLFGSFQAFGDVRHRGAARRDLGVHPARQDHCAGVPVANVF